MSREALEMIIDYQNAWAELAGRGTLLDIDSLTKEQANGLFRSIECDLSPENLTCDGELSRAQVQERSNDLYGAVRELESMGFTAPSDCYF